MIQRKSFQKLRAYATNQAFTPDQIRNANWTQVQNQLDLTVAEIDEYRSFLVGMKEILLKDALERERIARLILLKSQLNSVYASADLTPESVEILAIELLPYLYGENNG